MYCKREQTPCILVARVEFGIGSVMPTSVVLRNSIRCGKLELEVVAKNALERAKLNLNDKIERLLIEVDIEKSMLLLNSLGLEEDRLSL